MGRSSSTHKIASNRLHSSKNHVPSQRATLRTFDLSSNIMKMNDLDFDELLECAEENIENSAFFASSVQLMGIIDSTINSIDERLAKKKSRILNLPSTKNSHAAVLDQHQPMLA